MTTEEPKKEPKNIDEAILAIMKEVGYVQKQKGRDLNYTYAGEAALIAAIRPVMVESGVTVDVVGITNIQYSSYTTKSGTVMHSTNLVAAVRFTHAPSQTSKTVQAPGCAADAGDKADYKAATGAYKYALRQTLCIETGDDPDQFKSESEATLDEKKALFLAKAGALGYGTEAKPDKAAIKAILEPLKLYPYAPALEPAALQALESAKAGAHGRS